MRIIYTYLRIVILAGNIWFANNTILFPIKVVQNREVTLPCRLVNQSDDVKVYWYSGKDGWLTSGKSVLKHFRMIQVNKPAKNEWNLFIKEAQLSFEDTYTCRTDRQKIVSSYNLIIERPPKIVESESSPKCVTVEEGGTVELTCVVSGNPTPEVKWYRGESETPIGISGHLLRIRNVTRYATDVYMCRAINHIRNAERIFILTVNFAPEAEVKDSTLYVEEGEVNVMSCIVQGSPLKDAYWIDWKGERLKTNEMSYKYQVKHEEAGDAIPAKFLTLIFYKHMLGDQDYGTYTCVAAGNVDLARANVQLKRKTDL